MDAFWSGFCLLLCLVRETRSDLYKLIFPSADPKGNQARGRGLLCGLWSVLASISPIVTSFAKAGPWAGRSFSWTWLGHWMGYWESGRSSAPYWFTASKLREPERNGTKRKKRTPTSHRRRGLVVMTSVFSLPHNFGNYLQVSGPCFIIRRTRTEGNLITKAHKEKQGEQGKCQGLRPLFFCVLMIRTAHMLLST